MPKAAAQLGAAVRVLPLPDIGAEVASFVMRQRGPKRARLSKRPSRG
jgi:hypothetical protein